MELRDYLEIGARKAGSLTALGKLLNLSQPNISGVKAHKRPLPIDAVVKLADYIGADLKAVIAANELVTEKKDDKRAYWLPFAEHARAACAVLVISGVTSFVTPTPAQAAPIANQAPQDFVLCKIRRVRLKQRKLHRTGNRILKTLASFFTVRTPQTQAI